LLQPHKILINTLATTEPDLYF